MTYCVAEIREAKAPPEYSWQRAFRLAGDYADDFLTGPLGRQAAVEGWSRRLRSYVQILAWRQLCSGTPTPLVEVPTACVDHWRLCWNNDIRVAPHDAEMPSRAAERHCGAANSLAEDIHASASQAKFCATAAPMAMANFLVMKGHGMKNETRIGRSLPRRRAEKSGQITRPPGIARDPVSGVEIALAGDDGGTPERHRHDDFEKVDVVAGGELRRVFKVSTQTPLDRYRRRSEISEEQWWAGERLRRDFTLGSVAQRVTAAYAEPSSGGSDDWSERRLAARERFAAALRSVGLVLSPVLMHVACLDGRASDWAASRGYHGRRAEIVGMTALQLGLDALRLHYRPSARRA